MTKTTTRTHRSAEERIADLQAKIEAIKGRDARKKARANPAVRLVLTAAKALDKAQAETDDEWLRKAATTARAALADGLEAHGVTLREPRQDDQDELPDAAPTPSRKRTKPVSRKPSA